jgi:cytochrome P450
LTKVLLSETEKKGAAQSIVTPGHFLKLMNGALIDTIASWGFSINLGAVFDVKAPIPRTYIGSLKTTKHGQQFLWWAFTLGPDFLMSLPLRPVRILNALGKFGIGTAESIVNPRIAAAEKADKDHPQPHDMLSIFMKSDKLSNHDLVHQSAHMIAGSTETTASTLGWAVHLLSRHPECQDRIREEVRAHLSPPVPAEGNRDFNDADFRELKYLDAVLKEILRFHSVNTILWRELTEQASIAGTSLPKGTRVGFSPWTSGRDPRFWGPEGRIFNPDRWLKDPIKGGATDTLAFLTFGAGPRRCPGEEYAKAQLRCIIAGIIGRFELSPFTGSNSSDVGTDVGDFSAFTLFKVMEGGLEVNIREVPGW